MAEAERVLQRWIEAAPREIIACLGARPAGELGGKMIGCKVEDVVQSGAMLLLRLRLRRHFGEREPRFLCQALDRFGKGQTLSLHEKIEDIAVLAGRMVEPGHFLVVD